MRQFASGFLIALGVILTLGLARCGGHPVSPWRPPDAGVDARPDCSDADLDAADVMDPCWPAYDDHCFDDGGCD